MDKKRIALIKQQFDIVVRSIKDENIEYWFARELMPLLGYERWENFDKAISRAVDSCQSTGIEVSDHFREVTKMVQLGSGSKREVKDYILTRYACYLIAQNGDPKKEEIAFAQSYFAFQTRKQVTARGVRPTQLTECSTLLEIWLDYRVKVQQSSEVDKGFFPSVMFGCH